ncbi:hypothetical protein LOK49_LG12G01995 [Camellia lanceoleosa]|uniref:Uncharacterized protein n=1 Tax=Camellia lanceoleosa TaxID=1840588 RepID=A0ACC0FTQ7_9ERIC|nr:hypothetical protein LOK49_LG12G01995 [Camellia lanceoleosa]
MEISTQNSCNWKLRGPPLTMGQTHFSQIQHQDGYNWQLFDEPESLQVTQLGYFQTYGGGCASACGVQTWCGPITCIPSLNDGRDHSTSLGEVNAGAGLNDCPKHTTNV